MWKKILTVLLLPYALWLVFAYRYHFIDNANLIFHEGGHIVFGFMGETMHFLGGTFGQLFFPIACALQFWRQEKFFEAWVCLFWLGESLMYMAEYMADAQAMALPLVGGGVHDWNWLFYEWGMLDACVTIARFFHVLASILLLVCLSQLAKQAWRPDQIRRFDIETQ
ncbi:MAG: hypothetical protein EP312_08770 [Gammaproteobacteria bacterium]|nr:MAG: hypothetical protein EP312_08770 [Gammaproteobacteria bacterium]